MIDVKRANILDIFKFFNIKDIEIDGADTETMNSLCDESYEDFIMFYDSIKDTEDVSSIKSITFDINGVGISKFMITYK